MNPLISPNAIVLTEVEDRGSNFPNQAISFGGGACKGVVPYVTPCPVDMAGNFSVECTVNLQTANQTTGLVLKGDLNNNEGEWELLVVNGAVVVRLNGQTTEGSGQLTGPSIPVATATEIRFTYDLQHITLFVNGVQVAQNTYSTVITILQKPLTIGNYLDGSHGLVGKIYEIRICNQIPDNNGSFTPPTSFNVDVFSTALLRCNEGIGNQVNDIVGNLPIMVLTSPYTWAMRP